MTGVMDRSIPYATLVDAFECLFAAPERAGHVALFDENDSYDYPSLREAIGARAAALRAAGVRPGDRVAIAMERSCELVVVILGTMAAGACPCPLEPRLGTDEVARRQRLARLEWTVFDDANRDHPAVTLIGERAIASRSLLAQGWYWQGGLKGGDASFLLFTSGSSGLPKGVLQNHGGMLTNTLGIVEHTRLDEHDRLLHVMPLYHTNGVNNQILAPLFAGSTVILADRFRAEAVPDLARRHRPTIITGVPTMFQRLLSQDFREGDLASVRMLRCGSAPITPELHRRIEEAFAVPLVVSYGLSEATCTSTMNPPEGRRVGSVGTPLRGQDVFLLDGQGRRIPPSSDMDGEICIGGTILSSGYLLDEGSGQPEAFGEMLRTGDLGRFDADGYLRITGRIKDVIIRGGENLSPGLIEEALATHPSIAACCVVPLPDEEFGEVPIAFVVLVNGSNDVARTELDALVMTKLSPIHKPSRYRFVAQLPENSVGKIDRKAVRLMVETS